MRKARGWLFTIPALAIALLLGLPSLSPAQLVLGQYEDEAPLRTWNLFGIQSAASIGRGETSFTLAADTSVALTNPALLIDLPKLTATFNLSSTYASLNKYSIVNTGLLFTDGNSSISLYGLDFGGVSVRFKNWAFSLNIALVEIYDRPVSSSSYASQGTLLYEVDFRQEGLARTINFALAGKFGRLQAGVGINYFYGDFHKELIDTSYRPLIIITDTKDQDFSGFFINGGILFRLSDRWDIAAVFRTPFGKEAEATSLVSYSAPAGQTEIRIEAAASNLYRQPLILGFGTHYLISPKFRVLGDVTFFDWSSYEVEYFDETLNRNFRDTVKLNLGGEYHLPVTLFGQDSYLPLRFGAIFDKQPMAEPSSSYFYFTLGTGLRWKMLAVDFGASFGKESGSGDSLSALRLALSFSVTL